MKDTKTNIIQRLRDEGALHRVLEDLCGGLELNEGQNQVRCPFPDHPDETPSFTINTDLGMWRCFGCGHDGDVLDLTMRREGLGSRADAAKLLEEKYARKHTVSDGWPASRPPARSRTTSPELIQRIVEKSHALRDEEPEWALPLLEETGATFSLLRHLGVGVLPRDDFGPARLVLPGYSPENPSRPAGVSFRSLRSEKHRPKGGKETHRWSLGPNSLIGLLQMLSQPDSLRVLCAGDSDLLAVAACVPSVVALSFTCGEGTVPKAFWACPWGDVVNAYDADPAGQRGAANATERLEAGGNLRSIRRVEWPTGWGTSDRKDVADYMREFGRGGVAELILGPATGTAVEEPPLEEEPSQLEEEPPEISREEAWEHCRHIAGLPNVLDAFAAAIGSLGVVGEERVLRLLYLAVTSRLLERPVSVAVKGPSSCGKSFVVERVLDFFPPAAYYALSSMSEKALAYSEEPVTHRMLVIYEASGLASDFAQYLMRSLLSEGRIRYETVDREGGKLKARLIEREGPTGLIVTTTENTLNKENETRLLSVTVNDTKEQTRAILRAQARNEEEAEPKWVDDWRSLQLWIQSGPRCVAIPYLEALAELTKPEAVRLRRDFPTLRSLIGAHALLHQASRARDDQGRLVATIDDYAAVRDLVADIVAEGVQATVSETTRATVTAVRDLVPDYPDGVPLSQIKNRLDIDKSAASRRWRLARDAGYLRNLEDRRGRVARIVLGEPMPDDVDVFPTSEDLVYAVEEREAIQDASP